jgi:hypothetical protein
MFLFIPFDLLVDVMHFEGVKTEEHGTENRLFSCLDIFFYWGRAFSVLLPHMFVNKLYGANTVKESVTLINR